MARLTEPDLQLGARVMNWSHGRQAAAEDAPDPVPDKQLKNKRGFTEKLVTLSKKETLHSRRMVLRHIHNREVVAKLFDTLSARYAQRPGGYTRVIKLGPRRGDNAEMAIIELVGSEISGDSSSKPKKAKAATKKSAAGAEKTATRKATPQKASGSKKGADSSSKKGAARSTTTRRSGGS